MLKKGHIFLLTAFCMVCGEYAIAQISGWDEAVRKAEALTEELTLEEKAGQMTNISLMALAEGEFWMRRDTVKLDTAKIRDLLIDSGVGSVQNLGTYPMAPDEWHKLIGIIQEVAMNRTRHGIPLIYGIDAVHGANYSAGSTLFPHQIGMAATRNPSLTEQGAAVTSYELKACGIPWNYSPVLDVSRHALWGRIFETYGEDTYLCTVMGEAFIKGSQGDNLSEYDKAAVCLKHFWAYGHPANGKDRSPVYLPERMLRQIHLPPFKAAVDAGALTVMINSGSVNGVPSHADRVLLTDILKGELGFEGFTISDWEDVTNLVKVHQVAADEREAVKLAVNAGLDMSMAPYDAEFAKHLVDLVRTGEVKESRVDDAVRRILAVKYVLGLFENPLPDPSLYGKYGSTEFAEMSLEAARESLTLLKNENSVLPLSKNAKVLVTGVAGHSLNYLNGAWSRTWGGEDTSFNDPGKATIYEAVADKIGRERTTFVQGTHYDRDTNTTAAAEAARDADAVIVCLGERPATEKPSDIDNLEMPRAQLDLVKAVAEAGKPVILLPVEARPRIITEVAPLADGILMAYLPGNEGGRAVADVLFGDVNPSGKLPFTYPRHSGTLLTYDHTKADRRDAGFGFEGFDPLFEFGHGLSYTTFEYSDLNLSTDTLTGNETIVAEVTVKNTGDRKGKETAELYSADLVASIVPAVKQLRRFEKIELEPGESETIRFTLTADDLSFVDRENRTVTETGEFELETGGLKALFYYKENDSEGTRSASADSSRQKKRNK